MRIPAASIRPLLLLALGAALAPPAAAQRIDPNRVFDLTVQADGQVMSATVREGGTFDLTLRHTDEYRMVPVAAANGRAVTMAVYRGTAGQPSTSRIVERVQLTIGQPATLRTNPGVTVILDRIRSAPPARQASAVQPFSFTASASLRRARQSENCCVCCGNACACACGVKMSCGSCCMSGCCTIQDTSTPADPDADPRRAARMAALLGVSACDRPFPVATAQARVASR